MSNLEVVVTLPDGNQASYSLDRTTTLSQFRDLLKEDDFMAPEEMFRVSDQNSLIPKSQEKTKTLEALKIGDVLKITVFNKAHANQEGDNSPTKQMTPFVKSIEHASNELLSTIIRPTGENIDVMDLGQNEMESLLNNCAYLYGRTITSNMKVKLGSKRFFADIPQNHRFEKSNRGTTGSGFLEKIKLTSSNEEHELYSQGYTDGELEADIKFIAKVHGKLGKKHTDETKTRTESKHVYAEISFSKASFALSEMRSVISDDVKTFFKHGEKITLERLNQFFDTFGAIIPDRITVGGKFFSSHEVTVNTNDDHTSKKIEGEIGGSLRYKVLKVGGSFHSGKEEEAKHHDYNKVDEHVLQCYGGDASCKDKPDEWIKSLNNNYKTWQIVNVDRWSWSYDYLEEEFKDQIKELLWLCTATKLTYPDGGVYEGDLVNNKRHGKGKMTFKNGNSYFGDWKNDSEDGKGKYTWSSGGIYTGEFKNNSKHGKGTFKYHDGGVYEGEWKNDHKEGKGTYKYTNENIYEGEWKQDKREGKGKLSWANGETYEGEWKNGEREGKGKKVYTNKNAYEGEWKESKREGKGKFTWINGDLYDGEWKNDHKEGKGTCKYDDGRFYEGDWKQDNKEGKGKMIYASKDVYEGEWKQDKKEGKGKYTWTNGDLYEGDWKQDKTEGRGILIYANKNVYEGEWKESKKEGKGKMTYANGVVYEGAWKENKKEGQGRQTWPTGGTYDGEFKNDQFEGKGTFRHPNGSVYEGEWKAGKKEGQGRLTLGNGGTYDGEFKDDQFEGKGTSRSHEGNVYEGEWKGGKKEGKGKMTYADGKIVEGSWANNEYVSK